MLSMFSSGIVVGLKLLSLLSLGKASLAVAMILWQDAAYFNGLHRFCRVAGTLPFFALEQGE